MKKSLGELCGGLPGESLFKVLVLWLIGIFLIMTAPIGFTIWGFFYLFGIDIFEDE